MNHEFWKINEFIENKQILNHQVVYWTIFLNQFVNNFFELLLLCIIKILGIFDVIYFWKMLFVPQTPV